MRFARLMAALAALAAMLVMAPAAAALTFTVDDAGDTSDADTGNPLCDDGTGKCTLRAAIEQANATPGADEITFTGAGLAPAPTAALPTVTEQLLIDGGGNTTVTFAASATGSLLDVQAPDSVVRSITFAGGGDGRTIHASGAGVQLASVAVVNSGGEGIRASGTGARLDAVRVEGSVSTAIYVDGANVTVSAPVVRGAGGHGLELAGSSSSVTAPDIANATGDGLRISGSGATISGGSVSGNRGNGATIFGQNDTITRVTFWSNGGRPVVTVPGANGGLQPPQNLRIGPRRSDGSLPLTGTAFGTVELWQGDHASSGPPSFLESLGVSGDFTYTFPSEPAAGTVFSAMTISGGSSEFATVAVPADIVSPEMFTARAMDTENVRVFPTEPIDANTIQKEDFALMMAGAARAISAVSVAPDGSYVNLASAGWKEGEAGYVQITAPGAFSDVFGNQSQTAPRLRVFAAPGDFRAPLGARLRIAPKTICLTRGRRCRRPGMKIRFETPEPGKATIVIKRGNKEVGRRTYGNIVEGRNTLKFNGRLNARKLRVGRYRFLLYLQDKVGNVTDQPPITLFSVRRTTR